ncbi:MAG: DsbA family protein [Alphaproteobacteria bacterium]
MRKAALFLTVALIALVPAMTWAADAVPTAQPAAAAEATFTDAQRAEIENIIKDYLTNKHPEVIMQGADNLKLRQQEEAEAKSKEGVAKFKDRVFNDPNSPVGGNPKGDVTIVEFYDFNCGYCKAAEEGVERLLKEDKNIKFIYKDFPILGPTSFEASKAALASVKQGKFQAFHDALFAKKEHLTSDMIYQTAKDVGLDVEKLKKDMEDPAIKAMLSDNIKLGQDIGLNGTPMFIINEGVIPGAIPYEQMKKAVADARAKKP